MKIKRIALLICVFLMTIALASCNGTYNDTGNSGFPIITEKPTSGGKDDELIQYTVRVYRENPNTGKRQLYVPNKNESNVKIIFKNENSVNAVEINQVSKEAVFMGDGNYDVYLSALPKGYAYNPNIYSVSPLQTTIEIDLEEIISCSGNGNNPYSDAYKINRMGYYQATLYGINDKVHFMFNPPAPGTYSIETRVDVNADEINPIVTNYVNNSAVYIANPYTVEGGGASGLFTNNVVWEYEMKGHNSEDTAWQFNIAGSSKSGDYPVTIIFEVKFVKTNTEQISPYEPVYPLEIEKDVTSDIPNETGSLKACSDDGVLDMSICKYNSEDGYWYRYSNVKNDYVRLVAYINRPIPSLGNVTLEQMRVTEIGVGHQLCHVSVDYSECNCYCYFLFGNSGSYLTDTVYTGTSYLEHCNSDGVCYVTNELKNYLQSLPAGGSRMWIWDGESWALIEQNGISSGEDDMWLFACGYYE